MLEAPRLAAAALKSGRGKFPVESSAHWATCKRAVRRSSVRDRIKPNARTFSRPLRGDTLKTKIILPDLPRQSQSSADRTSARGSRCRDHDDGVNEFWPEALEATTARLSRLRMVPVIVTEMHRHRQVRIGASNCPPPERRVAMHPRRIAIRGYCYCRCWTTSMELPATPTFGLCGGPAHAEAHNQNPTQKSRQRLPRQRFFVTTDLQKFRSPSELLGRCLR